MRARDSPSVASLGLHAMASFAVVRSKRSHVDDVSETLKRVRREVIAERHRKRKNGHMDPSSSEGEEDSRGCKRPMRERVVEKVARSLDRFAGALGVPEELVGVKIAAAEADVLDDFQRRLEPELRKRGAVKERGEDDQEEGSIVTLVEEVAMLKVEATALKDLLEATRAEKRGALFVNHQLSAEISRWRMLWEEETRQRQAAEARLCYAIKPPMLLGSYSPPYVH